MQLELLWRTKFLFLKIHALDRTANCASFGEKKRCVCAVCDEQCANLSFAKNFFGIIGFALKNTFDSCRNLQKIRRNKEGIRKTYLGGVVWWCASSKNMRAQKLP